MIGITSSKAKKKDYTKWEDGNLVKFRDSLALNIAMTKEDIASLQKQLLGKNQIFERQTLESQDIEQEIKNRGIGDFESRMRKKHGNTLSDKQWRKVYRLAWDEGHSAGENEVENYLIDLVDLFED